MEIQRTRTDMWKNRKLSRTWKDTGTREQQRRLERERGKINEIKEMFEKMAQRVHRNKS